MPFLTHARFSPEKHRFPYPNRRSFNSVSTLPTASPSRVITSWASGRSRSTTSTVTKFHGVLAQWRYLFLFGFQTVRAFLTFICARFPYLQLQTFLHPS